MRSDFPLAASLRRSPGSGRVATGRVAASCRTSGVRRRAVGSGAQQSIGLALETPSFGYVRSKVVNDENASHGALHQGELLSPVLGVRKPQHLNELARPARPVESSQLPPSPDQHTVSYVLGRWCPRPIRASPGPKRRTVPSPKPISNWPDTTMTYWRRGAGCQSRKVPAGC